MGSSVTQSEILYSGVSMIIYPTNGCCSFGSREKWPYFARQGVTQHHLRIGTACPARALCQPARDRILRNTGTGTAASPGLGVLAARNPCLDHPVRFCVLFHIDLRFDRASNYLAKTSRAQTGTVSDSSESSWERYTYAQGGRILLENRKVQPNLVERSTI